MLDLEPRYRQAIVTIITTHLPQAEIVAYGSRVKGRAAQFSDLDLTLRQPKDLHKPLPLEAFLRAQEALRESNIPFTVQLSDWALLPESFRSEILKDHLILKPGQESHAS